MPSLETKAGGGLAEWAAAEPQPGASAGLPDRCARRMECWRPRIGRTSGGVDGAGGGWSRQKRANARPCKTNPRRVTGRRDASHCPNAGCGGRSVGTERDERDGRSHAGRGGTKRRRRKLVQHDNWNSIQNTVSPVHWHALLETNHALGAKDRDGEGDDPGIDPAGELLTRTSIVVC